MPFGKTEEQKAAQAQARADAAEAARQQAYWASPVGQAVKARQGGARFFQVEIPHASVGGYANLAWGSGTVSKYAQHSGAPDMLGQIEEAGWHLEHASWVFVETGQSSRDKVMASGQSTVVTGRVVGIYLFRAV